MYIILADIHAKPQHAEKYLQALLVHAKKTRVRPIRCVPSHGRFKQVQAVRSVSGAAGV